MRYSLIVGLIFMAVAALLINELFSNDTLEKYNSDLKFSHKQHVSDLEAECEACHPNAAESTSGTDDLLPKEAYCLECHEKTEETCIQCHNSNTPKMLPRIADYNSMFSHKKHADEGIKCMECHAGVDSKEKVSDGIHLPSMDNCMNCHETPEDIAGCYSCHNKNDNLIPADHSELWKNNHGSFAESSNKECSSCHRESYCIQCHLGKNLFGESHPPEFMLTHSFSYLARESDCASCHVGLTNCIECHTKINFIKPASHNSTPIWLVQHMTEGKINRDLCITCHAPNDPTCIGCHR